MPFDWSPIRTELALWHQEGLPLAFWWRDDDAVSHTPALNQLTALATQLQVPAHLAIIPKHAGSGLIDACNEEPLLVPLVHGWSHENRAHAGQKKAEFGHPRSDLSADCARGLLRMNALFGADLLPCFVPPWNRIDPSLIPQLPTLGFTCLSTFTPRLTRHAAPGLTQINTHLDPIDWRGGGGLVDPQILIAKLLEVLQDRRHGRTDLSEPLGLLTHHLVHDAPIWDFTKACLTTLLDAGAIPVNLLDLKEDLP